MPRGRPNWRWTSPHKTLPYFRHINSESLTNICDIIPTDIKADAVAITNQHNILAYVGIGAEHYNIGHEIISEMTRESIESGKITIKNNDEADRTPQIHSLIIIPLWEKGVVTGSLKIYYCHAHQITYSLKVMAVGLSQIISTQIEVSRIEQLREIADRAELRTLQSKINPHFLFNALNAISSSISVKPDTARQLIINLSRYLRYKLELNDEHIDIKRSSIKSRIILRLSRRASAVNLPSSTILMKNCPSPFPVYSFIHWWRTPSYTVFSPAAVKAWW